MTTDQSLLDRLCSLYNIASEYTDIWGQRHLASAETKQALLAAMGVNIDDQTDLQGILEAHESTPWQRLLPPVLVIQQSDTTPHIPINAPTEHNDREFDWALILENGERLTGRFWVRDLKTAITHPSGKITRYHFLLPVNPDMGYHRFELIENHQVIAAMSFIVTPNQCFQSAILDPDGRVWGPALQLYALRSQRNWGIGDLVDLRTVMDMAADLGAAIVGINPLNALFPRNPNHASPYSPSSRLHLNIFYLNVEAIPEFNECQAAQEAVNNPQFQARLRALRASELVDYEAVSEIKLPIFELLYRYFRQRYLKTDSHRGRSFRNFAAAEGERLYSYALFEALQEHFHQEDPEVWGWPVWPEPYRDPNAKEVVAFAAAHQERIEFYEYLQWRLVNQLEAIGNRSLELGLGVGLYQDLAVGVDRGGAEVWANQNLYAVHASTGAPPDDFSLNGQDWGLPPLNPMRLYEAAYEPFIATLQCNMRYAGALRIDHIMGLMRLFWVPPNGSAKEGTYVSYPFQDLLGIVALESHRNQCMVIGEDLGTVPNKVRDAMASLGIFSYRLFYFEKEANGEFKAPKDYPSQALVAISTHDLPTLNGYWQGVDLDLRDALDLYPSQEMRDAQIVERAQDRARLRMALEREELLPADMNVHSISAPEMTPELSQAIHLYLAHSPARLMMVQMEDVFAQVNQVNLPGSTIERYPNWRYKLVLNLEDWLDDSRLQALAEGLRQERGVLERPPLKAAPRRFPVAAQIPNATYRLQFHSGFTFTQATAILPYLKALGISHCYASPYLRARPGSTHGYDIIDHHVLNPDIGDVDDFERFSDTLRQHDMGQILDVVPNHMGVMGSDNAWWLDVLANGPAAVHAPFFDIDWEPFKEELRGKVLLPVLGNHYGAVLENGELQLCFDGKTGAFYVQYYDHLFPIDPREYCHILGDRIEQLQARLEAENPDFLEYQSLVTAFSHIPERSETAPEKVAERARDKEIHKKHLAELCQRSADIAWFIEENLRILNGSPGEPQSFDLLHNLLERQAYRLSSWRVASDDINYRRFFDINDLAGLRMENEAVFKDTHDLVIKLLAEGKLDGLRIDHPDGLYEPKQYFRHLQNCLVTATSAENTGDSPIKPVYVVVEKILESYERLPEDWPVHGTTGYGFTNLVNGVLIDSEAEQALDRIYQDFIDQTVDPEELLYQCKKLIMKVSLNSELNVLANQLTRIAQANRYTRDFTLNGLHNALEEIVACFPVYRTYITQDNVSEEDKRYVDWAVSLAKKYSRVADASIFDFVHDVLLTTAAEGKPESFRNQVLAFAMKFQQYTGPLMAKGSEDTYFYRYNRLVSLNEVGGDPRRFGISVSGFHRASQERVSQWPNEMLSTSTHDSKRSEDVRSRINVLTEFTEEWDKQLKRWRRLNKNKKRLVDGKLAPSSNDEYLLYQTLVGAWPLETHTVFQDDTFQQRIENYMLKAVKEAKVHSSWINPNAEYEDAVKTFVKALLDRDNRNRLLEDFLPLQERIAYFGMFNSLSQTLLKLTSPGVPDIYQGCELWDFSLVDPDNRRPVHYVQRENILRELQNSTEGPSDAVVEHLRGLLNTMKDGRIKLYTTWKTLALRQTQAVLFREGEYAPITVTGDKAEHICAFARRHEDQQVLVIAPRLFAKLLNGETGALPLGKAVWGDTFIDLRNGAREIENYTNVFTQETLTAQAKDDSLTLSVADLLRHFPLGLLVSNHQR